MSEAQQKAREMDVTTDVQLAEQQRREASEQTKRAAKLGTAAGQDPENRNLYDALAEMQSFLKGDESIKIAEIRNIKRQQEKQLQNAEKQHAEIEANSENYTPESYQTYTEAYNQYVEEASRNLDTIDQAIKQGETNQELRQRNITYLDKNAVNPPTAPRPPQRTSPPATVLGMGPPGIKRLQTRRNTQFIDALGETEQAIGQQGIDYLDSINLPTREPQLEKLGAEGFEAYERRFNITSEIRLAGTRLGIEAREPLEYGEPANLLKVIAGSGLTFTSGAVDTLTMPIRPGLWAKIVQNFNKLGTEEGRIEAVSSFTADPTGGIFGAIGGYSGGLILTGFIPPKVTVESKYRFPSEIDPNIRYPNQVYQASPVPKGVKLYTDYSGELRRYIPASERWNRLVMGGDQFINDAVYTTLTEARPTGATIPINYQSFDRIPSISPIKVTRVTTANWINPDIALAGALMPGNKAIESLEKGMVSDSGRNKIKVDKPKYRLDLENVPLELPDVYNIPIQLPNVVPIEESINMPRQKTYTFPDIELPTTATPDIKIPTPNIPDIYTPNQPKPPKLDTEPRRKNKTKKKKRGKKGVYELRFDKAFELPKMDLSFKKGKIKEPRFKFKDVKL